MISSGNNLSASFAGDWVGEWNLGPADAFEVARFNGRAGQPHLYVHNTDGLASSMGAVDTTWTASTIGGSATTDTAGTGERKAI